MPDFTTSPVDWAGPWGGVVHVAAWCPDRHDQTEQNGDEQ